MRAICHAHQAERAPPLDFNAGVFHGPALAGYVARMNHRSPVTLSQLAPECGKGGTGQIRTGDSSPLQGLALSILDHMPASLSRPAAISVSAGADRRMLRNATLRSPWGITVTKMASPRFHSVCVFQSVTAGWASQTAERATCAHLVPPGGKRLWTVAPVLHPDPLEAEVPDAAIAARGPDIPLPFTRRE